ncbi:peptide-methionine (R)-S-oxide reductase MsrB [Sphingomonas oligophenolica]|uniref:peptide-methionine (R)-S-oxide reductase n=1 Tax=Sphingomonas oligophenolica TaxID=301154 RepID=A0A502CKA4_9SPHN|nr:peptide-methionine (R)-S-oxide reductase MsrB [Sphingomonas oligophenolica]TPG13243.1 peptide-methionine (R)-S-oxide reductase [Sphingomonas oligophenolica]
MTPDRRSFLALTGTAAAGAVLWGWRSTPADAAAETFPVSKTPAQWKAQLGPAAYNVLREAGTERPGSSPLNDEHRAGIFHCKGCDNALYSSKTKFDSGTGWPSFWAPLDGAIVTKTDRSMLMARTEVRCARCGGHQGHVFNDGPKPTGKRYCMNGVSMTFKPGKA